MITEMWKRNRTFLPQLISPSAKETYINDGGKKGMIWLQMYRFAFLFNPQTYVWCYLIIEAGSLFSDNFLRNTCLQWDQSLISYTNKYISRKHSLPHSLPRQEVILLPVWLTLRPQTSAQVIISCCNAVKAPREVTLSCPLLTHDSCRCRHCL